MTDSIIAGNRFDSFDPSIALEIALIVLVACGESATARTLTPTAITVIGGGRNPRPWAPRSRRRSS